MLIIEFTALFIVILVLGYLVPAGKYYYWYYVRENKRKEEHLPDVVRLVRPGL
jgi:hypothetical protein